MSASEFLPKRRKTLTSLKKASQQCHGCGLYKRATQTVFGQGPTDAKIVMVGEIPGDLEDRKGAPFVGPAGGLLNRALEEAGIPRDEVYITNAVKHFKWAPLGKRRLHKRPSTGEIKACRPWLESELDLVKPLILVCLGSVAAQSVFGKIVRIHELRGAFHSSSWTDFTTVTIHPSAILRSPDSESRHREYQGFLEDLRVVAKKLKAIIKPK